ncbi:MAG: hypothetical protein JST75_09405 [Bacteroidetes bacterium]|nr:hypothetical protein [Bacteroidota bacterium]
MRKIILIFFSVLFSVASWSQRPVQWSFSAKKISERKYEFRLIGIVQDQWHTYSQNTLTGGPVPTKVSFEKNPSILIDGEPKEIGQLEEKYDSVFEMKVKTLTGKIEYVQLVEVKTDSASLSGSVEYMACNNHLCMPPKKFPFTVSLE